ncbi:MAG: hypothetical protein AAFR81_25510 [Chloroflexota bacterium]
MNQHRQSIRQTVAEDIVLYNILAYLLVSIVACIVFALTVEAEGVGGLVLAVILRFSALIIFSSCIYGFAVGMSARHWMKSEQLSYRASWTRHILLVSLLNVAISFVIGVVLGPLDNYPLLATGTVILSALVTTSATALAMRQQNNNPSANEPTKAKLPTVDFKK